MSKIGCENTIYFFDQGALGTWCLCPPRRRWERRELRRYAGESGDARAPHRTLQRNGAARAESDSTKR